MAIRRATMLVATALAGGLLALGIPAGASAAPAAASTASASAQANAPAFAGWTYYAEYGSASACLSTGSALVRTFPGLYAAYYCEEYYDSTFDVFRYQLFLYRVI